MSILRDFEQRLEGAFEGFFARAFRSGLQPVELAKAVQRYAGHYQQVGIDGVIVPNVYRFVLSGEDLERFEGYLTTLQRELADVVSRTASERGWHLKGPVRIEFDKGSDVRLGTYELRGKIEAGPEPRGKPKAAAEPDADAGAGGEGGTSAMPAGGVASQAVLHVLGRELPPARLRGDSAVIGRLPECDVTIEDPSVSRRHARLYQSNGHWRIEDLGSTNGTKVNGERVGAAALEHGDRIQIGGVRLAFSVEG